MLEVHVIVHECLVAIVHTNRGTVSQQWWWMERYWSETNLCTWTCLFLCMWMAVHCSLKWKCTCTSALTYIRSICIDVPYNVGLTVTSCVAGSWGYTHTNYHTLSIIGQDKVDLAEREWTTSSHSTLWELSQSCNQLFKANAPSCCPLLYNMWSGFTSI